MPNTRKNRSAVTPVSPISYGEYEIVSDYINAMNKNSEAMNHSICLGNMVRSIAKDYAVLLV